MTSNVIDRWTALVGAGDMELFHKELKDRVAYTVRQNRRHGKPRLFEYPGLPIGQVHHCYLTCQLVPAKNGGVEPGLVFRLSNAVKNEHGILIGGRGKGQVVAKRLHDRPTKDGAGASFKQDDELLSVALDLLEALMDNEPVDTCQQVRVLGSTPTVDLLTALQSAAIAPGEWNLFQTPCAGTVSHVETDGQGCVRIIPDNAEQNVHMVDEVPIVAGTKPAVSVGDRVALGASVLQVDLEAIPSLTEAELDVLSWFIGQAETTADMQLKAELYVGNTPLYDGVEGVLYEDVRGVVGADGVPITQVVKWDKVPIFSAGNVRLDARRNAVRWEWSNHFQVVTPREAEREGKRHLRRKGPKGALRHVLQEALEFPAERAGEKLDYVLKTYPFRLQESQREAISRFNLETRWTGGEISDQAAKIDEFLKGLLDAVKA